MNDKNCPFGERKCDGCPLWVDVVKPKVLSYDTEKGTKHMVEQEEYYHYTGCGLVSDSIIPWVTEKKVKKD